MGREVYIVRIGIVLLLFTIMFGALGTHVYYLQVTRHEELLAKAQQKYTTSKMRAGQRGIIYDRRGNMLAGNIACKDILAIPKSIPADKLDTVADILADTLEMPRDVVYRRLTSTSKEVTVKRGVNLNVALGLDEMKLPGLRQTDSWQRFYPKTQLLANVLGFCDTDNKGVFGLEQIWDSTLQAQQERERFERSRRGLRLHRDTPQEPRDLDGDSIYLTIEEPIQHIMEEELAKMADEFKPLRAYALMVDPKTGAIMGMAQWPSFDPNDRSHMDPALWQNHMISDVLDPGSTMKGVSITGAIDYGIVDLDTQFDCENGFWFYAGRGLRDSGHKFSMMKVRQIVEVSSNIGTAKIALEMGQGRLYQTFRRFGFGERTNLGLRDESPGILRPTNKWDGLSITRYPIGQGISVTPVQMVQAYATLANGGRMMQLHLVDQVADSNTGTTRQIEPEVRRISARKNAVDQMVEALIQVTEGEEGTAPKARVRGYNVAGKTGTSQKLINGTYEGHRKYISSFVGFVPAYQPAFALIVLADEPSNGKYYGGTVAAPTWSRIAERTLQYLNVPPLPEEATKPMPTHVADSRD